MIAAFAKLVLKAGVMVNRFIEKRLAKQKCRKNMKKNSDDENKIVMVIEEIEKTTWTTASMQDEVIEDRIEEIDIAKNEEEFMIYSKAVTIKEPRIISIYVEHFNFYTVQAIIDHLSMLLEADLILVQHFDVLCEYGHPLELLFDSDSYILRLIEWQGLPAKTIIQLTQKLINNYA